MAKNKTFQTQMQVGLGEAIRRVNILDNKKVRGIANHEEKEEHGLLMDALDHIKIDLGFDCNDDGVPDTIEIFTQTAQTSCCRLVQIEEKPKRKKTSSRRKKRT